MVSSKLRWLLGILLMGAAPTAVGMGAIDAEANELAEGVAVPAPGETNLLCFSDSDPEGPLRLRTRHSSAWDLRGWVNAGIIGNTDGPDSHFNGPYNAVDRANEPTLNQLYLIAEKRLPCHGTGLGARLDLLYGEDYLLAQSLGVETQSDGSSRWNDDYYGLALPQAYVSLGNQYLSLQAGHFYSVVGYEGVMAPDNLFYSKSYSYQFAGPFQHWGTQLNWTPTDAWTVNAGLINGWNALDRVEDHLGFIGRVRYDNRSLGSWTSFAIVTGDESNNVAGLLPDEEYANRTRYSWLAGLPLTAKLDYVFHHWLGFQEAGFVDGERADWFGIDQYLTYRLNRNWKAGARFEWFNDEEGTRVGLNRSRNPNDPPFPGEFYSTSVGLNWTPTRSFMMRPEIRADWYDGQSLREPFNDGLEDNQLMLGFDATLMF